MSPSLTLTPVQRVFAQVHSSSGLRFPETVAALLALGVTRYHVDYVAGTTTTYAPTSAAKRTTGSSQLENTIAHETEVIATPTPLHTTTPSVTPFTPSMVFSAWNAPALTLAIARIQANKTTYAEFSRECIAAGVAGYMAFLAGKRVLYYGCDGDVHVEWFPGVGAATPEKE
ncbi:hypothetical protein Z517_06359 [Fonsecaea pedrosoi CBS 271.37]|uniref:Unplaced genomic scaffold supercont1.4, whole genome shotgun sequence n=1 Tax=Fonsecaea pedrosoi CBS 271.37 TaxID=1442368 RepID=A0A0D2GMH9_9EURO|nr:uncharacterized protein Z517_06359 [Fonsecaea pedrosoi CBS 271.37]KIW79745.1 hypothetical protein Z517_06359 [Fonsecaea pedrosoi CBS 271.37]